MFRTINDLEPAQDALVRIDINSPVEDGEVQDNKRFNRHATTIRRLLDDGHSVTLLAHQGRPGHDDHVSLKQHANILSNHVGQPIQHVTDIHSNDAKQAIQPLSGGEALLLENVRFSPHELEPRSPQEHAQNGFVSELSSDFDCYINDAYSAAHRAHASLVGFPHVLDAYAGPVMAQEYEHNSRIQNGLDGSTTTVLGGKKAADVLYVMEQLVDRVDNFLIGGVIGELFLRAEGHDVGYDVDDSQFMHKQWLEHRDTLKHLLNEHRGKIHLPLDLAYHDDGRERTEVTVANAAKSESYWDIGHDTVEKFAPIVKKSDAVFVKGALGVFEDDKFSYGTRTILDTIGGTDAFSVVGGGDTSRCVDMYDLGEDNFSHVSIAGGAYIRALAGEALPAVEALRTG